MKAISVYGIYLNRKNEVLLIQDRSSNLWGFPGGGIEKDESDKQALVREFQEEVGLTISQDVSFIAQEESPNKTLRFYRVHDSKGKVSWAGNGDDVLGVGFFKVDEVSSLEDTVPGLSRMIDKSLSIIAESGSR